MASRPLFFNISINIDIYIYINTHLYKHTYTRVILFCQWWTCFTPFPFHLHFPYNCSLLMLLSQFVRVQRSSIQTKIEHFCRSTHNLFKRNNGTIVSAPSQKSNSNTTRTWNCKPCPCANCKREKKGTLQQPFRSLLFLASRPIPAFASLLLLAV
jgi:hypothetical protein